MRARNQTSSPTMEAVDAATEESEPHCSLKNFRTLWITRIMHILQFGSQSAWKDFGLISFSFDMGKYCDSRKTRVLCDKLKLILESLDK